MALEAAQCRTTKSQTSGEASIYAKHSLDVGPNHNIRLVRIIHTDCAENVSLDIAASVAVFALETAPPYTALSYVWGTDKPSKTIVLGGQAFRIRDNLWAFLDSVRHKKDSDYFWIDALCIDQTSIPERNHQVTMMGQIYSRADKVIAWFGATPDLVAAARELISAVKPTHSSNRNPLWIPELVNAPYWRRAWIIQEFVLAQHVEIRCGDQTIGTGVVDDVVSPLFVRLRPLLGSTSRYRVEEVLRFRRERLAGTQGLDIDYFTTQIQHRRSRPESADPRDRIFSQLSLVDPDTLRRYPIVVDYNISASKLFNLLLDRFQRMQDDGWYNEERVGFIEFRQALRLLLEVKKT